MFDALGSNHEITPASAHDETLRADAARIAHVQGVPFHWAQRQPATTPGAYEYAFDTLGLPEFYPAGAGISVKRMPNVFTAPSFAYQGVTTVSYGGLAAGQSMMQPLYDPETNSYGGYPLS